MVIYRRRIQGIAQAPRGVMAAEVRAIAEKAGLKRHLRSDRDDDRTKALIRAQLDQS